MLQEQLLKVKSGFNELVKFYDEQFAWMSGNIGLGAENRKNFAIAVNAAGLNIGFMMARFTGKVAGFRDYVSQAKKNGAWSDGFLDSLLEMMNSIPEVSLNLLHQDPVYMAGMQ